MPRVRESGEGRAKDVLYVDAAGRRTDDPAQAASGEIAEHDRHGRVLRRTRFFLDRSELPWLPVSEPAFLLWVLAGLVLVWACIGIVLRLT
jgi:hypothetical protein